MQGIHIYCIRKMKLNLVKSFIFTAALLYCVGLAMTYQLDWG